MLGSTYPPTMAQSGARCDLTGPVKVAPSVPSSPPPSPFVGAQPSPPVAPMQPSPPLHGDCAYAQSYEFPCVAYQCPAPVIPVCSTEGRMPVVHRRTTSIESGYSDYSDGTTECTSVPTVVSVPNPPTVRTGSSPPRSARMWRHDPYTCDGWTDCSGDRDQDSESTPRPLPASATGTPRPQALPTSVQDMALSPPIAPCQPPPPPQAPPAASMQQQQSPRQPHQGPSTVTVQHKHGRADDYLCRLSIATGDYVIVEGDRGDDLGMVVDIRPGTESAEYARVKRRAKEGEVRHWHEGLVADEKRAAATAQSIVEKHNVNMRIVHAEYQFDKKKLTFYFTSRDKKPQVKEALSDCYAQWRCRVWFSRFSKLSIDRDNRQRARAARGH